MKTRIYQNENGNRYFVRESKSYAPFISGTNEEQAELIEQISDCEFKQRLDDYSTSLANAQDARNRAMEDTMRIIDRMMKCMGYEEISE